MKEYERRAEDRDTRDLAMKADTKIDSHLDDCIRQRENIKEALNDIRDDLKKINWIIPLVIGGIIVLGKVLDYFFVMHAINIVPTH